MAAGMGSRYGGLKQIDPIGTDGEVIIDYSIFDAIKAGFTKVVFIIRRDIEKDFCERFFNRIKKQINAEYVFQEGLEWRKKPLGTTGAVLSAKGRINEPFCVINADDFYGRDSFFKVAKFLKDNKSNDQAAMVVFKLGNTLSDFGTVSRGVIVVDEKNNIKEIKESTVTKQNGNTVIVQDDTFIPIQADTNVNVNFFGFTPAIFPMLERIYNDFLGNLGDNQSVECLLPVNVGQLIKEGKVNMSVIETNDKWMGVTHPLDKQDIVNKVQKMVKDGIYPSPLWN